MVNLRGTGVAVVTPFHADGSVDFDSLGRLLDHIISGGVQYVVSLGTTGETPTLSKEEKKDIIRFTCDHVGGRVPVVVGAGGNDTAAVIRDLQELPLDRAAAVLSASPYYNKPSQEGLFLHYEAIAKASPLPLILYNVPGRTGRNMEPSTTLRIAREVENVIGIKEAGNSIVQCMDLLRDRPEGFWVVSGDDDLVLPEMACGMDGVISVAANAFPAAFTDMVNSCLLGDYAKAREINNWLMTAYRLMFAENNPAGVKAFLYELGLIQNNLRLPLVPLSAALHKQVKNYLESSGS